MAEANAAGILAAGPIPADALFPQAVRVSFDHGTAFGIAGQGIAREDSLVLAAERAARAEPGIPGRKLFSPRRCRYNQAAIIIKRGSP